MALLTVGMSLDGSQGLTASAIAFVLEQPRYCHDSNTTGTDNLSVHLTILTPLLMMAVAMQITTARFVPPPVAQQDELEHEERVRRIRSQVVPPPSLSAPTQGGHYHGHLKSIALPRSFVAGEQNAATKFLQQFHCEAEPSVRLAFSFRAQRLSPGAAINTAAVLSKPAHSLDQSELYFLRELLLEKAFTGFKVYFAKTEEHNGKKVIVVEGQHLKWQLHSRTMYIDADSARPGSLWQEITYQAPTDQFNRYFFNVMKSLKSIEWV